MAYKSVHLIANGIIVDEDLPFAIGRVTLRRPNEAELSKIREVLEASSYFDYWVPYEAVVTAIDENDRVTYLRSENPADWHYYVLADDVGGNAVYDLEKTLMLMEPSIDLSVRLVSQEGAHLGYAPPLPHIHERYHGNIRTPHKARVALQEFIKAEEVRLRLLSLETEYQFINYALQTMGELRRIPQASRLQVIGLFSVIENLITHSPRLKESLDSISFQLRGKLRLLTNLMGGNDLLTSYFGSIPDTKVWMRLYEYRSRIAHGSKADFEGDLKVLRSNENVVNFLVAFTRRLWFHALENPQFVTDLKEC